MILARHQDSPQEMRRWNEEALKRAEVVGDDRFAASIRSCI
jgi:hypothetical protein